MGTWLDEVGGAAGDGAGAGTDGIGKGVCVGRGVIVQPARMVAATVEYAARRFLREGMNRFMVEFGAALADRGGRFPSQLILRTLMCLNSSSMCHILSVKR